MMYYHKFFVILTIKGSLFKMIFSIIGGQVAHNSFDKIALSLKIIVDEVIKILNSSKKEPKFEIEKNFFREAVTDFFASLLDEAS